MEEQPDKKRFTGLFSWLSVCFLAQMLLEPLFEETMLRGIIGDLVFYSILVAAAYNMKQSRLVIPALILFFLTCSGYVVLYLFPGKTLFIATNFMTIGFLIVVILSITMHVAGRKTIRRDAIMGGLCAYMLIGFLWTVMYVNVEIIQPGSFDFQMHGSNPDVQQTFVLLYYFSFMTLLTIGYGDIIPMGHMAQSLTILEGLVGQFYLVFFVAVLVGLYVYRRENSY